MRMKITLSPLDSLFSEYVRKRAIMVAGGCEKCLTQKQDILKENGSIFPAWKQLQTSHFFGRRRRSVRYNEDNACGLCFSCHQHFTENPLEHTEWFKKRLGDKAFGLLEIQANTPQKIDKQAVKLYLQEKIKEVEK